MPILPECTPQYYLGEVKDQFANIHRLGGLDDHADTGQISAEMTRSLELGRNLLHYLVASDNGLNIVLHTDTDAPDDEDISTFRRNDSGWLEPRPMLGAGSLNNQVLDRSLDQLANPITKRGEFYYGCSSRVVAMSSLVRVIGDGRCSMSLLEKAQLPTDAFVASQNF